MVVDEQDMLKLESYDLERIETISAGVDFNTELPIEDLELSMEFSQPKLKQSIKIQHVQLATGGTTGKGKGLF